LQKFLWRVPWDAHGEVATSGNAGSLHIFAEADLNRIGVPTRTTQQVLHPEKPAAEKGFYIHPELFGAAKEKSIAAVHHPALNHLPERQAVKLLKQQQ
jgi:hypothetical protein